MLARSLAVRGLALGLLCASLAACGGPLGPIPGGRLRGEVGAADNRDWSFAASEKTAQLETDPDHPHSVNVWFTSIGPSLYVPTSMIFGPKDPTERGWVENVEKSPLVRIRLAGSVYARRAVRVTDRDEYARARAALETKYEQDPEERDLDREVWIFRLDPRD
jgi:hypothetical protein